MNFLKRLFGTTSKAEPVEMVLDVHTSMSASALVSVSGMMTTSRQGASRFAQRRGLGPAGYAEVTATLEREITNRADPRAVVIIVDGDRIGYLPGWVSASLTLRPGELATCALQVFTEHLDGALRAEAWAWLGDSAPVWRWSRTERPPMSVADKRASAQRGADQMVRDALEGGGERAADFQAGIVDGRHYLQLVEPIKQLKREGRLEEALGLCYQAIEGAQRSARRDRTGPPPFYTEQAAIVHRKQGERDAEIAVLRRYLAACPVDAPGGRIRERLDKMLGSPRAGEDGSDI